MYKKIRRFLLRRNNPIGYAREIGVTLGTNCRLIGSPDWGSEPFLISIGNHVEISNGVSFITHDGATWVFRNEERYEDVLKFGRIIIKDDCFIGARSIIFPNVEIGKKSIVGAGSVVTKNIPDGEVWAGVPAHFIITTNEYAEKCLKLTPEYDKVNYKVNFKEEVLKITQRNNLE